MAASIFVSLTHRDNKIAEALERALKTLLGPDTNVYFSTSKELGRGIASGQNWFNWIVDKVQKCDFAVVLITPASVQKPWILWEAGAVYGAAVASKQEGLRKVRPLVFRVRTDDLPSPIRESQVQLRRGDSAEDVKAFLREVVYQYREALGERFFDAANGIDAAVKAYGEEVDKALRLAPMLADSNVIEEWRHRLDELLRQKRASEVEHLHQWLDIAFGREQADRPQPLDLRIHSKLADLYLKAKKYPKAIQQLELARQLAPRDIYVLRTLGRAYLENQQRDEAKTVVDSIDELDAKAVVHNVECAALAGRWYREAHDLQKAEAIYRAALNANPDSYYLANLLAEVRLDAGDRSGAEEAFRRVMNIMAQVGEQNVWTHASMANAAFFCREDDKAALHLQKVRDGQPDADALQTIERGLKRLADAMPDGTARLSPLAAVLRP